jgi:hypothetical protein
MWQLEVRLFIQFQLATWQALGVPPVWKYPMCCQLVFHMRLLTWLHYPQMQYGRPQLTLL